MNRKADHTVVDTATETAAADGFRIEHDTMGEVRV